MNFLPLYALLFLLAASSTVAESQQDLLVILPDVAVARKPEGEELLLACTAKANNVTNLRWLDSKNNVITGRDSRIETQKYPNNMGLALTFVSLSRADEGTYTCQADCGTETLSKSVKVMPYRSISWIDAATEQQALKGTNYKIKCKVESDPAPSVFWQTKDSTYIESSGRYIIDPDGLTIQNVQETDSGDYRCKAIIFHPEISDNKVRNIHLEVIVPPTFTKELSADQEVVEGEPADIVCKVEGKPQPIVSWIRKSTQQNMTTGVDGILHLGKVTKEDDGIFKCVASNTGGRIEHSVHLKVLRKPEIIDVKNATIVVNGRTELKCYASGYPIPTITIKKLYSPGNTGETVRVVPTNFVGPKHLSTVNHTLITSEEFPNNGTAVTTLIFNYAEKTDSGLYECVAENRIGRVVKNAYLAVEFPPTFENTGYIKEVVTWRQRPVNITCLAESIPNATITWFFNSREISANNHYYTKFGNGPQSSLQVTPHNTQEIYGAYKCCATNVHGSSCHNIQLREAKTPGVIPEAKFESVTATTITFKFVDPIYDGGLPIKAYSVQYKLSHQFWNDAKNKTWPAGSSYILEGLQPKAIYNFRFAVANEVGYSEWGANAEKEMPERSTPSEPVIINPLTQGENYITSSSNKQFELRWNLPADNGVPVDKYKIRYCVVIKRGDTYVEELPPRCEEKEIPVVLAPSFKISDLIPDTYYKVELRAHNNIGYSGPSERYVKTLDGEHSGITEGGLSSGVIIYIVVAVLIALLVIVDISCFFIGKTGLLYMLFGCCCGKKKKADEKLTSEGKDLISNGHGKKGDVEDPLMIKDGKKETAVEYDIKKGVSKTGFAGKDSAV